MIATVICICVFGIVRPDAAPLTQTERQRLIAHLEMTSSWLVDEVSGLSEAQLTFRRAPGTWTILEVLDHLVVVGPIYWEDLQNALKTPAGAKTPSSDTDILWYGVDRTNREKAIPSEVPKGVRDIRTALAAYRKSHEQLVQYIKTTDDDLRGHIVARQRCDAYQWALLISTHEQRHVLQIREVKADPSFPKPPVR
jgi:hypothetical protein